MYSAYKTKPQFQKATFLVIISRYKKSICLVNSYIVLDA